jgi:hypothetical protein
MGERLAVIVPRLMVSRSSKGREGRGEGKGKRKRRERRREGKRGKEGEEESGGREGGRETVFILIWKFLSFLLLDSYPIEGMRFEAAKWWEVSGATRVMRVKVEVPLSLR